MVSIIIVHYKVKELLFHCIASLIASNPKTSYEIIVVDNDEKETIGKELNKKFPKVVYKKSSGNIGFGAANNQGAVSAKGDYLLFLNPDTTVSHGAIDTLVSFLTTHKQAGVVAPLLLGKDGKPYQQGSLELTPKRASIVLSILNKYFPNNSVSNKYFLKDWDQKSIKEVSVVPGTAFMIRKDLFEKIDGFDNQFFLYFEEFDLAKRVRALGKKLFIIPSAQVSHIWGASTKQYKEHTTVFARSRFLYFQKHFGLLKALIVEGVLGINKTNIFLFALLVVSLFLTFYKSNQLMPFIGDQAWYYLSARNWLLSGEFPLVGITSSHTWLHQGAYWSYLLAGGFVMFGFNPLSGLIISAFFQIASIVSLYVFGSMYFSKRVGIIASVLFVTSSLVIIFSRMPYHTTPIPFFTILFLFSFFRWIQGNVIYFPLIIFLLAVLYNFELATFIFSGIVLLFLCVGLILKKRWVQGLFTKKIILYSLLAYKYPMLPMLIYDISHGYVQTAGFVAWVGYKILTTVGIMAGDSQSTDFPRFISYIAASYQRLIYIANGWIAGGILLGTCIVFLLKTKEFIQAKRFFTPTALLVYITVISLIGLVITRTASDAYVPMIFPTMILITALFFDRLLTFRSSRYIAYGLIVVLVLSNIVYLFSRNFILHDDLRSFTLEKRTAIVKEIIRKSDGKGYNIQGKGNGSQFESFLMSYEYLAWYLGHEPTDEEMKRLFTIIESKDKIQLKETK